MRARLLMLWIFTLVVCVALAFVIRHVYQLGTEAQTQKTMALAEQACATLRNEYPRPSDAGSAAIDPVLMRAMLNAVLGDLPGLEGGYWHDMEGFVAYAFPTHEGSTEKKDVPSTEKSRIETLTRGSLSSGAMATSMQAGRREAILLAACPIDSHLSAWTMARVPTATGKAYAEVNIGLALLLAFVVISGTWLGYSFHRWSHQFGRLERQLRNDDLTASQKIEATGDAELDRIVVAINHFRERLQLARDRENQLGNALSQAERFAAVGRIAAALAHEIRNPLAAVRLKAENALAQPERLEEAMHFVLQQVGRIDGIVKSLLSRSEPVSVNRQEVEIGNWLAELVGAYAGLCEQANVTINTQIDVDRWRFDPVSLGRAVDNLLANALAHAPEGSAITVKVFRSDDQNNLVLQVCDAGPGVDDQVRLRLFEPFVTGRAGGFGLGLALAREVAIAHGGTVRYIDQTSGACFELEIPWRES